MTSVYDFHQPDFIFELSILSNHTKHLKKTSAVLYTTFFYTWNNLINTANQAKAKTYIYSNIYLN